MAPYPDSAVPGPAHLAADTALGEAFLRLGDALIGDFDIPELLDTLAARCASLDGVAAVGITVCDEGGNLTLVGASHEHPRMLELVQQQSGRGPLFDCFRSGRRASYPDLANTPWPWFADAVAALGFRGMLAVPMRLRMTNLGAVTVYLEASRGLSHVTVELAQALADIATMSVLLQRASQVQQRTIARLDKTLTRRSQWEQIR